MSTDNRYNGWANYETWLVNLWLGNDSNIYDDTQQLTSDHCVAYTYAHDALDDVQTLARNIQEYVENVLIGDSVTGFVADLVNSALGAVDWRELAINSLENSYDYREMLREEEEDRAEHGESVGV